MKKATVVMTIAGSDSGGGAGIEADIKTIASLGLHGTCAITSVTSQNTTGVLSSYDLPPEVVVSQVDAVCADMQIEWAKSTPYALTCRSNGLNPGCWHLPQLFQPSQEWSANMISGS